MKFKVGDKVRCIAPNTVSEGSPKLGEVYTVVRVYRATHPESGGLILHVDTLGGWFASRFELVGRAPVKEPSPTTTPHKWAKEIIAWANGAEIEVRYLTNGYGWSYWTKCNPSEWNVTSTYEYRIKPEKKPDVVGYMRAKCPPDRPLAHYEANDLGLMSWATRNKTMGDNIQCTFDGETGKLKAVEILG